MHTTTEPLTKRHMDAKTQVPLTRAQIIAAVPELQTLLRNPQRKPANDVEIARARGRGILVLTKRGRLVEKVLSVGLTGYDEPEWGLRVVDIPVRLDRLASTLHEYAVTYRALTALRRRIAAKR